MAVGLALTTLCQMRPQGAQPPILAHVCCGQTAGWIKMPLSREVALNPIDFVLDGGPSFPKRGTAPNFQPMSVVAK